MIAARNQRVYIVLDPDEAEELKLMILRSACTAIVEDKETRKQRTILKRLDEAMERAREKGAKFTK